VTTEIKSDWWIVKVDGRSHWSDDVQRQTVAVYDVYAFDANLRVHICSLTPSYELHYLGTDADPVADLSDDAREHLYDVVLDASADNSPVDYMDVSTIERMRRTRSDLFRHVGPPDPDSCEEAARRLGADVYDRDLPEEILDGWNTGALVF